MRSASKLLTIWAWQSLHSVSYSFRLKVSLSSMNISVPLKSSPLRRCCLVSMQSPSDLFSDLPSLYGRHVCRTGTAACTGTTCPKHAKMSASYVKCRRPMQNVGTCRHFDRFSKNFRQPLGADCSAPRNLIKEL